VIQLVYIVLTTFGVALIAFIGVFMLAMKEQLLDRILLVLVSLSAGALMGGAFIHLLPEAVEDSGSVDAFLFVLVGFILFFILEKVLHWRHCHSGRCDVHTFHYLNLIGDSIHNFIDGLIIATSFIVSFPLGVTSTVAIAAHEVPQEIGDFGVLIYGGFERRKAIVVNFLIALGVVVGGVVGYFVSKGVEHAVVFLLPFAAGGFIYIAATDLIPEIKKEVELRKSSATMLVFICGIFIMWLIRVIFEG
jgi:zinc and cadmium transporter